MSKKPSHVNYPLGEDIVDSRDMLERMEYLESFKESKELDDEDKDELKSYQELRAEIGEEYFDQGITFIDDSYWSEYAEEEFYTAYSIKSDISNIWYYVDWNKWENDLQIDYTSIDIDGWKYHYRQ